MFKFYRAPEFIYAGDTVEVVDEDTAMLFQAKVMGSGVYEDGEDEGREWFNVLIYDGDDTHSDTIVL